MSKKCTFSHGAGYGGAEFRRLLQTGRSEYRENGEVNRSGILGGVVGNYGYFVVRYEP